MSGNRSRGLAPRRPRHGAPVRHGRRFRPHVEALEERCLLAVDAILEWNAVMLEANAADHARASPEQGGPILTGRAFAIVSAAMYDAYNAITHIGEPYLVKARVGGPADARAAVARAAHDTLVGLFPSQQATFDAALARTLEQVPDGPGEQQGLAVGAFVARQLLRARAGDGASEISSPEYVPNGQPGFHAVDPLHPDQPFYATGAAGIAPFAVEGLDQCLAPRLDDGTPEGRLAFLQSEAYTDAYNEVKALGGDGVMTPTERTAEQTEIGLFWAYDGRPGPGTPPRLYNQIARAVAVQEGNTEAENARLFALLNIAMADAGFTAWKNKYDDAFWRPVLGVRNGESDGNPDTPGDPDWAPLGAPASNPRPGEIDFTPPFPAYTSGHATIGAAAFQVLARFYGRDDVSFTFTSDELNGATKGADGQARPLAPRTFGSFSEAKLENALSRIYLGIHWRFDAEQGIRTGDEVADHVFSHFLRPDGGRKKGATSRADGGGAQEIARPSVPAEAPAQVGGDVAREAELSGALLMALDWLSKQTGPGPGESAQPATSPVKRTEGRVEAVVAPITRAPGQDQSEAPPRPSRGGPSGSPATALRGLFREEGSSGGEL